MPTKVVVCDTPDGLAQLQYVLIKSGAALEIETVTDGLRAVEVSARTRPDLVVAGIEAESLSGAELVRRLLAVSPETKVICWADASPLVAAEMLQAGAAAYVSKEDGPEEVFRAMRAVHAGPVALSPDVAADIATRLLDESNRVETLETTIAEISDQLQTMTTAKADFLANVSHELRTPVTVAKGIAYVLKNRGIPKDEEEEFIGQLEASLEKLSMLIEEMLIVADLDRGTLSLELSQVDLAPLLRQVADESARQFPAITIEREINETLPASADPMRFIEIVRQLLDNACRYSPEDQPVQLKGRPMDEGVVVSVTDHGEGMARQTASKAFEEPFSAGEDILRKERAGAGVGLHMARQLVVQHGGILWADPLPSGGTRVSFVIPAHEGDHVGRPEDFGSDPLDELHSLSEAEPVTDAPRPFDLGDARVPNGSSATNHISVAPLRGSVVQLPCPGAGARVRRGAAKTGWNPALSRNREAPFGDESGRLPRGASDGPRRKGGLWAARTRPIAAPSDRREGGWANLSASSCDALAFALAACSDDPAITTAPTGGSATASTGSTAFPVTVTGTSGDVTIDARPERIVSLSPTATEDLFAIGAGDQVIAVDDQSNYPADAPTTDLSGFEPNVEAIAGYEPDLVVFATEPGDLGASLEGLGITALQLDAAPDLDVAYDQIEQLGAATGHADEAAALVEQMRLGHPGAGGRGRPGHRDELLLRAGRHVLLGHVEDVHRPAAPDARPREHRRRGGQGKRRVPAVVRRVHHRVGPRPDLPRRHEVLRPVGRDGRPSVRAGPGSRPSQTAPSCRWTTTSPQRWGPRVVDLLEQISDAAAAEANAA